MMVDLSYERRGLAFLFLFFQIEFAQFIMLSSVIEFDCKRLGFFIFRIVFKS